MKDKSMFMICTFCIFHIEYKNCNYFDYCIKGGDFVNFTMKNEIKKEDKND